MGARGPAGGEDGRTRKGLVPRQSARAAGCRSGSAGRSQHAPTVSRGSRAGAPGDGCRGRSVRSVRRHRILRCRCRYALDGYRGLLVDRRIGDRPSRADTAGVGCRSGCAAAVLGHGRAQGPQHLLCGVTQRRRRELVRRPHLKRRSAGRHPDRAASRRGGAVGRDARSHPSRRHRHSGSRESPGPGEGQRHHRRLRGVREPRSWGRHADLPVEHPARGIERRAAGSDGRGRRPEPL